MHTISIILCSSGLNRNCVSDQNIVVIGISISVFESIIWENYSLIKTYLNPFALNDWMDDSMTHSKESYVTTY